MIIPVRCFGCGKVLADKRDTFLRLSLEEKHNLEVNLVEDFEEFLDLTKDEIEKMAGGRALDQLGLIRDCCRTVMLSTIDLLEEISY